MTKNFATLLTTLAVLLVMVNVVQADQPETGNPWRDHAMPFNFMFGNLIDNHQQTMLQPNGRLVGQIYIRFTGEEIDGVPVAIRADCTDPSLDCRVGWIVQGVPMQATLVQKSPRKWKVDPAMLPQMPGFNHFHWVGSPMKPCGLTLDDGVSSVLYDGYLLKRTAVQEFYWFGGSGNENHNGRLVSPGIDPHSNVVTSWDYSDNGGSHGDSCGGHDDGGSSGGSGGHDDGGCDGHDDGSDDTGCGGH